MEGADEQEVEEADVEKEVEKADLQEEVERADEQEEEVERAPASQRHTYNKGKHQQLRTQSIRIPKGPTCRTQLTPVCNPSLNQFHMRGIYASVFKAVVNQKITNTCKLTLDGG